MFVIFFFPETNMHPDPERKMRWAESLRNITKAFSFKRLRTLYVTTFLFGSGFSFFTTFIAVFLISKFSFSQGMTGNFFAYVGVSIVVVQAVITRYVSKRWKSEDVLKYTIIASGLLLLAQVLPDHAWGIIIIVPFFAMMYGLSQANIQGLISTSAGPDVQGEILGINASVQAVAQSIPPVLAGFVAALLNPSFPIVIAGVVTIAAGVYFVSFFKSKGTVFTNGASQKIS